MRSIACTKLIEDCLAKPLLDTCAGPRETWEAMKRTGAIPVIMLALLSATAAEFRGLDEALEGKADVWGEAALVSFYGMLAQALTRDSFIGGEGCSLTPLDENGRLFYCPPNSAGNAFFLATLRNLLVQDWDLDDDGKPETLRLLFATPRRWLTDGQVIEVERAATAFGEVSVRAQSHLAKGEIVADIEPRLRQRPNRTLLRARLPEGWRIIGGQSAGKPLEVDAKGTADVSVFQDKFTVRFQVEKIP